MDIRPDPNNPELKAGESLFGYDIRRIVELKPIRSLYYELQHAATGTRHIHISNDDAENTFSVAFKTVPVDSTGVAHILEHTVLCGSLKYPVRDPFFSMLKRSLSTFMNAFTASDWTMYPFSTQNPKDYYNLMDVYLDAAFFPKLDPFSFKQEGHRLDVAPVKESSQDFQLQYSGVVYNEMKGAMSSAREVMARSILKALYPSTTYRFNSGGDPAVIPTLTYEQLKAFHERHYHPSNAFFYSYGNLPLHNHLKFIEDKILSRFDPIDPRTEVPSQPRWQSPKTATYRYPLDQAEDPAKKCQVCLAWLMVDIRDTFEVLILTLLEQILLGNAASPLRKALIDSELGTALSDGSGFDADNRDTLFAAGLKDVNASDAEKIEKIIMGILRQLADNGIDRKMIDAAIHQLEFHRKEITNQPYPYGIKLLLFFSGSWFHGGDPVRALKFETDLERLKQKLSEEALFENRIRRYFLENPHRVRLSLVPDQQMESEQNRRVAAELIELKRKITGPDLERIQSDNKRLQELQETPEDISVLPTLEREDIPPHVKTIKATKEDGASPVLFYQQPTPGIFYFSAAIGAGALSTKLRPLVPFFCHALTKIGTARRDYTEMVQLIDAYTGGVGLSAEARSRFDGSGSCLPFVAVNGKCLVRNQEKLFEIISELLGSFDFSDLDRLKSLLLEYRAGLEAMVVQNGHRLAMSLASRNFSDALALDETWHGVHQLQTIKALTRDLTKDRLKSVSEELADIGRKIIHRKNFSMALIGEEAAMAPALDLSASLRSVLAGEGVDGFSSPQSENQKAAPREGWATATAVSFVAQTFPTVRMGHADAPALAVIGKMLRSMFLHREIREKGGAYGGFSIYNPENGLFCFGSYRDPHIVATLNVYRAAADFIRSGDYDDEDIKEAILQVCSEIDKPDPPGPAARKAFYRRIVNLSDEAREQFKQNLLGLDRSLVRQAAERHFSRADTRSAVAVISSEAKLQKANDKLAESPLRIQRI